MWMDKKLRAVLIIKFFLSVNSQILINYQFVKEIRSQEDTGIKVKDVTGDKDIWGYFSVNCKFIFLLVFFKRFSLLFKKFKWNKYLKK